MNQETIQRKTACTRDCPDACGLIATIRDGRVIRLSGDPEHPVTRGFLCKRTSRYLKRQYDPSRITHPMVRRGDRWQQVRLEDALDLVAEKLLHYRETLGPASILNYRCGGSMGIMKLVTDFFFQQFGPVTIKSGDICAGAGDAAQEMDFGKADSNDIFDLLNANTIFLWGKNVYVSHVHLLPILKQAQANGTRLVLIDPVRHRTADLADDFVQIRPGGDAAIALGMARWLEQQSRWDPAAESYCDHLEGFRALVHSRSASEWAALAGISEHQLSQLATAYANGPTTILAGWGMQRRRNGAAIIRSIDALAAVTGNVGIPGGCVSFYFARKDAYDISFVDTSTAPRRIPEPLLAQGIMEAQDPPIAMVFVTSANPVNTLPDSRATERALSERFTVVVDAFMTDTARCADVFLPTVTMLEDNDLLGAYGHHYVNEVRPVVAAPETVLSDYEIMQQLAQRVGLAGPFEDDIETWKRRLLSKSEPHGVTLDSIRQKTQRNPFAAPVVFADRKFTTPSGRVNLITRYEHPDETTTREFPLRLMALSTDQAQSSQWLPEQQVGPATVTIHPQAANGFAEGDLVRIESRVGSLEVKIAFDDRQLKDVALMDKGGWNSSGRCANVLTAAATSDLGECAVYYDTPVRLVAV